MTSLRRLEQQLLEGWRALTDRGAADLGRRLLDAYAEPHRRYHDQQHLADVLDRLDELGGSRLARLGAWFHDAVYDPTRVDNEQRSAELAAAVLPGSGSPAAEVAEVARLVLLTATHTPADGDADGAALCDADLAILAATPDRYDGYAAAVRAEYAHVPDDAFRAGRSTVLHGLLDRPAIFGTAYGAAAWEAPARANLSRELAALLRPAPDPEDGATPPR